MYSFRNKEFSDFSCLAKIVGAFKAGLLLGILVMVLFDMFYNKCLPCTVKKDVEKYNCTIK